MFVVVHQGRILIVARWSLLRIQILECFWKIKDSYVSRKQHRGEFSILFVSSNRASSNPRLIIFSRRERYFYALRNTSFSNLSSDFSRGEVQVRVRL